jgi:hypothetical protein
MKVPQQRGTWKVKPNCHFERSTWFQKSTQYHDFVVPHKLMTFSNKKFSSGVETFYMHYDFSMQQINNENCVKFVHS